MRRLDFEVRYPETGYWYLRDLGEAYETLSEQMHHPVFDSTSPLKEKALAEIPCRSPT